jgi:ubiquinone/menaquinone biosynthesis methyltransferase
MAVLSAGCDQVERAEAAGVDEADSPAIVGLQHHMLVQAGGAGGRMVDQKAAGHAKMDQQAAAVIEPHEDVFGAAAETGHPRAGECGSKIGREGEAQIGAVQHSSHDAAAFEPAAQTAHHGLDFREFRHEACVYTIPAMTDSQTTDFGFTDVPRGAKKSMVRAVFDSVAPRYDLMNDLMSLGVHRAWKQVFATVLDPRPGARLLDLAGGTGDISFGWLARGGGSAILSDINPAMLSVGRDRAIGRGIVGGLEFLVADAEALPIPDRCVDVVSMAFGLRNCTDKDAVLREAFRVLRPGGRFCCLEFSRVEVAALAPLYDAWSFKVLPRLGALVAGDEASYRYLAESIRMFPDQQRLAEMFRAAGFARVSLRNLSGGIAAIHQGWRL